MRRLKTLYRAISFLIFFNSASQAAQFGSSEWTERFLALDSLLAPLIPHCAAPPEPRAPQTVAQRPAAPPRLAMVQQQPPQPPRKPTQELPIRVPPPRMTFAVDDKVYRLPGGPRGRAVTWDGCDPNAVVQGGSGRGMPGCGKAPLSPEFAEHLNKHFYRCVASASTSIGMAQPQKIWINHWGTYSPRSKTGGSGWSLHAYARAIDIANLKVTDIAGKVFEVSHHVRMYNKDSKTKTFYNGFRECWKQSIPRACYKGSIGIPHSPLGGDSRHNDHLHVELPECVGNLR